MDYPNFLYRYRPVTDYSLQEIEQNTVYLCKPSALNDPFDSRVSFGDNFTDDEVRSTLTKRAFQDGHAEYAETVKCMTAQEIAEFRRRYLDVGNAAVNVFDKWGVVCLTEHCDNHLMWAHYAKNHTGFVIEYALHNAQIPDAAIRKVKSTDSFPKVNIREVLDENRTQDLLDLLSTKHRSWAYEAEWRILLNKTGLRRFLLPMTRVITGVRMPDQEKTRVCNAIVQNGLVRFAQMVPVPNSYEMRIHQL